MKRLMTLVMVAGLFACTERGEEYDDGMGGGMGGSPPAVNEDTRTDTTTFPADTMTRDTLMGDTTTPMGGDTSRNP